MSIEQKELTQFFSELLNHKIFSDYGPNGLQIEGSNKITKIAFAVSATRDSVEKAVKEKADALVVHHGLFWSFHGPKTITGPFANRVKPLIQNNVNLYGFHLPLDAHLEVGNAASLAKLLSMTDLQPFGDYKGSPTGVYGKLSHEYSIDQFQQTVEEVLKRKVLISKAYSGRKIQKVGIITGGANSEWSRASAMGLDAYITGEMSEHDWNEAKEADITMIAGGHHATEQFGIQSLMKKVKNSLTVECFYIDSDNPA